MLIVDAVADTIDGCIAVPRYHGGHLSLRSETEVTVCLLPRSSESKIPGLRELVISPIVFQSWQYLTRINALFHDTPGVVRKLAHAIQKETLDILYEESATVYNGAYHRVEILVDSRYLYSRYSANYLSTSELLPRLERRLQAICLDELVVRDGVPRLKVRPMEGLRNAWLAAIEDTDSPDHPEGGGAIWDRTAVLEKGRIQIPPGILREIGADNPRVILVSDTRDRVLRVMLPPDNLHFTYIRVTHRDTIGSLFRLADALSHVFSAVLTLTRLKIQGTRNDVELLLYSPEYPGVDQESERRAMAESILASKDLADLLIVVSYPARAGAKAQMSAKPQVSSFQCREQVGVAPLDDNLTSLSTKEIVGNKLKKYVELEGVNDIAEAQKLDARIVAARSISVSEGVEVVPKPLVFISYSFSRDDLYRPIDEHLRSEGWCRVSTGHGPDAQGHPFREEIRERIAKCQGFISIWGENDTSPWLIWELGVAQAFGLPVCIFAHADLKDSPHLRLIPEIHHEKFKDIELMSKFSARWQSFKREVSRFDRLTAHRRVHCGGHKKSDLI